MTHFCLSIEAIPAAFAQCNEPNPCRVSEVRAAVLDGIETGN